MKNDIARLKALMPCLPGAYLVRAGVTGTNAEGKAETKYRCVKSPITDSHYEAHLDGRQALAVSPFLEDGKSCQWLVLDIDRYGVPLEKMLAHIKIMLPMALPLVLSKTKSGGWHLFLFLTAPAKSDGIYATANKIRFWLNGGPLKLHASSNPKAEIEVRPAQPVIDAAGGDTGNFITLPLFNSTPEEREAFFKQAEESMLTPEKLSEMTDEGVFKDGPCCLFPIMKKAEKEGAWHYRNLFLYQLAVFFRKKYPSDWKDRVREYNDQFINPPLAKDEIEKTIKSCNQDKMHYTCNKDPFESVCNKGQCQRRRYGVNAKGILEHIDPEGLTQIGGDPPTWHLTVHSGDEPKRMKLTTGELTNPGSFKKKCMEYLHTIPELPGGKEWENFINTMLSTVTVIPQPYEMSEQRKLWDLVWRFFACSSTSAKPDDLLSGRIYVESTPDDGSYAYFRLIDFESYSERQRSKFSGKLFALLKELELTQVVQLAVVKLDDISLGEVWRAKIPDKYLVDKMETNMKEDDRK